MKRTAIVGPASLGALSAYRRVIKDISEVLGDPTIDMARLFFAVMIQSGLERFSIPNNPDNDIFQSSLLSDRLCDISYDRVTPTLELIRAQIEKAAKTTAMSDSDSRIIHSLTAFLQELYLAAEFRRPVATVLEKPVQEDVQRLLREDAAISVNALMGAVVTIGVDAPVARYEALASDLKSFRTVLASDVFDSYVANQRLLERVSHESSGVVSSLREQGRSLVRRFPSVAELRQTAVRTVDAIPDVLDATAGKVFGAAAKPFVAALSDAIARDQRILLYSFYPTWRTIWNGKLRKARTLMMKELRP